MCSAGLPDSSWHNIPKREKIPNSPQIYQMAIKYRKMDVNNSKWPMNIPNAHWIYQHFLFQGPPKYTQNGIFGLKIYHLATLAVMSASMSRALTFRRIRQTFRQQPSTFPPPRGNFLVDPFSPSFPRFVTPQRTQSFDDLFKAKGQFFHAIEYIYTFSLNFFSLVWRKWQLWRQVWNQTFKNQRRPDIKKISAKMFYNALNL
jgi:hypothetical protein